MGTFLISLLIFNQKIISEIGLLAKEQEEKQQKCSNKNLYTRYHAFFPIPVLLATKTRTKVRPISTIKKIVPEIAKISLSRVLSKKIVPQIAKTSLVGALSKKIMPQIAKTSLSRALSKKIVPQIAKTSQGRALFKKIVPEIAKTSLGRALSKKIVPQIAKTSLVRALFKKIVVTCLLLYLCFRSSRTLFSK
jgi:hypothetical protein